jgi:hypothetical protein
VVTQLHLLLAYAALVLALGLVAEAVWRAWRAPLGRASATFETSVLIVILVAAAGGLGLLTGGGGPHDSLHLLYGVLAVGALPVAATFSKNASPSRARLMSVVARLVLLVLLLRLFQTG